MASRCGSLSRSLMSSARASSSPLRSSSPRLSCPLRPPPVASPRLQSRRLSFAAPREEWKRWVMHKDFQSSKGTVMVLTIVLEQLLDQHNLVPKHRWDLQKVGLAREDKSFEPKK